MPVETACPSCAKRYSITAAAAGRKVRCKACGQTFVAGRDETVNAPKVEDVIEPAWGPSAPPSSATPPTTATNGTTIGRFAIRGKLGAGAFGTVYRAYDPQLDRV